MKNNILYIVAFIVLSVFVSSCVGDLDVTPINPQKSQVFNKEEVFAKTYANSAAATITLPVQKGVYFITLHKNNVIFSQKVVL